MAESAGTMIGCYVVAAIISAFTKERFFTKGYYNKEDYKTYRRNKMHLIYWSTLSIYCIVTLFQTNRMGIHLTATGLALGVFTTTCVVKGVFICIKKLIHCGQKVSSSFKNQHSHVAHVTKSHNANISSDTKDPEAVLHNSEVHPPVLSESEEYWGLISFAYGKIKQTGIFKLWRREQFDCQFGKCAICGKPMEIRFAQVDHIKPRYKKGTNYSNNLALVHKDCNMKKGAKIGFEKPAWVKENKYSKQLDEKVYEITKEIRADYPTKFPDELFTKPTSKT